MQDNDSKIWITSNKGLHSYNGVSYQFYPIEGASSNSLFGLTKDNYGALYCFNTGGEVYKIVNDKPKLFYKIPAIYLRGDIEICFDKKNNLLIRVADILLTITPQKKLQKLQEKTGYFLTKKNNSIYYGKQNYKKLVITVLKDGKEKSVASYNTAKYVDMVYSKVYPVNNTFYAFSYIKKFFFNVTNDNLIVECKLPFVKSKRFKVYDDNKNLWFSHYKNGVYKLAYTDIKNPKQDVKKWFKDYYISGVMVDNEKNTWLLTFKKGIIIIPNANLKNRNTIVTSSSIRGISKINKSIYVSTTNGNIYKLNKGKFIKKENLKKDRLEYFTAYNSHKIFVTNSCVYKNKKKITLLSFCRKALLLNDYLYAAESRRFSVLNINNGYRKNLISKKIYDFVYVKSSNTFWLSTNCGLYSFKNNIEKPFMYRQKPLFTGSLLQLNNNIWAATRNGVYVFKNDSIYKKFSIKNGLLSNQINHLKYEKPYVYLSSEKGMQRYNTVTKVFTNFTFADGLTKKTTKFEVLNDSIYCINSDGLLTFTFEEKKVSPKKLKTKITKATANGTKKIIDNITLQPTENNLNFSFLTTTFKYQKELRYQYQLIGLDKKPVNAVEKQLTVNYSNVPSGKYAFKVTSFLGENQNKSAVLNFTISEYWYKTIRFRLFLIGLILLILYYIYKVRLNTVLNKRDKEELQKRLAQSSLTSLKAQMNPHFMFNAMNSIQTLILKKQNKEAYEYLTQLADLVRDNLKMSDVSFVHFQDELQLINKYLELEKLRFKETFSYVVENYIDNSEFYIPSMFIQPFIENSIKHGLLHRKTNRVLNIKFIKNNDATIHCIITDNGIGRVASNKLNENRAYKSFSTNAINRRFNVLNEYFKLDISFNYEDLYEGDKAIGTRVTIKLPFSNEQIE